MRMIIERADVLSILEQHFGETFLVENISMPEQFEIEIKGIPLPPSNRAQARQEVALDRALDGPVHVPPARAQDLEQVARRADDNASIDPPPPGNDETDTMDLVGGPASILEQSRALEQQLARERRPQRQGGSHIPPTDFRQEIG